MAPMTRYRLIVIGCVVSWFAVGLHARPTLHAMTHHGGGMPWAATLFTALLGLAGIAGLWTLLRGPTPGGRS
jgi:hypothetical protein